MREIDIDLSIEVPKEGLREIRARVHKPSSESSPAQ
jgi:hypothetical protein